MRYAALLRGTESAWQAISYGLGSIKIFAEVASVYLNFGLWAVAILPAWLVIRHFDNAKESSFDQNSVSDGRSEVASPTSSDIGTESKKVSG